MRKSIYYEKRSVCEMLKELRKKRGFTQEILAQKLSMDQATVSCWENGISTPTFATMKKIAEALECELMDIVICFAKEKEV